MVDWTAPQCAPKIALHDKSLIVYICGQIFVHSVSVTGSLRREKSGGGAESRGEER